MACSGKAAIVITVHVKMPRYQLPCRPTECTMSRADNPPLPPKRRHPSPAGMTTRHLLLMKILLIHVYVPKKITLLPPKAFAVHYPLSVCIKRGKEKVSSVTICVPFTLAFLLCESVTLSGQVFSICGIVDYFQIDLLSLPFVEVVPA